MRVQAIIAKDSVAALEYANAAVDLGGSIVSICPGGIEGAFIVWFKDVDLEDVLSVWKGRKT